MPRLASQHYEYLVKQLTDAAEGRRPDLAAAHEGLSRDLKPEQTSAVAAWLASLPAGD
jgi:cytochrome c553